ncbi:uncharacterized protein [Salminus brasiliensis]|uniref:uncharacterized protein n=1 Tax=Salminus brasiliensis TaxID=930266 RepID=UPI003B82E0F9
MKTVHLHFCLLLWCGAADGFTDLLVDLGQNVTLGCEISIKNVDWFLLKPSHPTVFILHSFSSKDTSAQYSDPAFRERFSLKYNGSLFIQNITVNELGIYLCINKESLCKMSNGIRLYINVNVDDTNNQTEKNLQLQDEIQHKNQEITLWKTLLITCGLVTCIMVITVTSVLVSHYKETPNKYLQFPDPSLQQCQDPSGIQVDVLHLNDKLYTVMLPNSSRNSTFTVVEFNQLSPVL